ncbi:hypothetical protein ABOM_001902 [Aspergillus bombycis]|uniref:Aminoglycoside phosphotransferase domain-containing protein n=1 Tax=Aspergillus bombycis TaxID=109264 RepID=A0A1F8AD87_9EURO|nr:hypothetical protein ABOM_001902 [Aspergillus bombycis]OGM49706.1 hypothetical protein ABOM_001902 [Aspergillus bombycis]
MASETNISRPLKLNLLSIRLWIGRRLFGRVGYSAVRISSHGIIKGPCKIAELAALKYVSKHTTIRVPKVLNVYHHRDGLYIELDYVSGTDLQAAWLGGYLSQDQKRNIITEVTGYVNQLRSVEPPRKGIVGSVDLEACLDHRVGSSTCGPFNEHAEFHSLLRSLSRTARKYLAKKSLIVTPVIVEVALLTLTSVPETVNLGHYDV